MKPARGRAPYGLAVVFSLLAACSSEAPRAPVLPILPEIPVGECVRNPVVMHGPPLECTDTLQCPCGMYCDENVCAYDCNVPPAGPAEACSLDEVCDDSGRCAGTDPEVPPQGSLGASPAAVRLVIPGPAKSFTAMLRVPNAGAADAATATKVRVTGQGGAQVSCDGAVTFGAACLVDEWSFSAALDLPPSHVATNPIWVKSAQAGTGEVKLRIDGTETTFIVPVIATTASSSLTGHYAGLATSADYPDGVPIKAFVWDATGTGNTHMGVLLAEPSRAFAPEGHLYLSVPLSSSTPPLVKRLVWVRAPGATATATGFAGTYSSGVSTRDAATGTLTIPLHLSFGASADWELHLQFIGDKSPTPECDEEDGDPGCPSGTTCWMQQCVSDTGIGFDPPSYADNQLDDLRSATWWDAIDEELASTAPANPFSTKGAELIENLLCAVQQSGNLVTGFLGTAELMQGTGPSRSGDLACRGATGPNESPGAVGLVTHRDRVPTPADPGAADPNWSVELFGRCLADLEHTPPSNVRTDYAVHVGQCVNLARFLPALRLLATGELGKGTLFAKDMRTGGLMVRLIQQWSMLHGFLASTGLAAREYDDAVAASLSEARTNLTRILDALDAGWAALLDRRVFGAVESLVDWSPTSGTPSLPDYRLGKQPLAYFVFNAPEVIRGLPLQTGCQPWATLCTTGNIEAYDTTHTGPSHTAVLPAASETPEGTLPGNQSVAMVFATQFQWYRDEVFPTQSYQFGQAERDWLGSLYAGDNLAIGWKYFRAFYPHLGEVGRTNLYVAHPTATGTELIDFNVDLRFPLEEGDTRATIAVVRDVVAQKYTLYVHYLRNGVWTQQVVTKPYTQPVVGRFSWIQPGRVMLRQAGPVSNSADPWYPFQGGFKGMIDDVGIFDRVLSESEFWTFAYARMPAGAANGRTLWPNDITLSNHATQEIAVPLGAQLLEAQAAHLDVVARFEEHLRFEAQVACESGNPSTKPEIRAAVARIGRTLRQSHLVQVMARHDQSERANQARQLLEAKRSRIVRGLQPLVDCVNPMGMAADEVPLYRPSISPQASETQAFFAASDYLLGKAREKVAVALGALANVRSAWDQARQSRIQELQTQQQRGLRVYELNQQYGGRLQQLCGLVGQSVDDIMQTVNAGDFDADTCFLKPATAELNCLDLHETSGVLGTEASCYRGVIGANLLDARAAYYAQQGAYQAWKASSANAETAERLCILKEIDAHGCYVANRQTLSNPQCPGDQAGQGTLGLISSFQDYQSKWGWVSVVLGSGTSIGDGLIQYLGRKNLDGTPVDDGKAEAAGYMGALRGLQSALGQAIGDKRGALELVMQRRAIEQDLRACWAESEQAERAVTVAEENYKQATAQFESASISFYNNLSAARESATEGSVVVDRELNRPSIPIAFHYWVPEAMAAYREALERARRYTYLALRAVEYDLQVSYAETTDGVRPQRSKVLSSWRPNELNTQLQYLEERRDTQTVAGRSPSLSYIVFDVGREFWGLPIPYNPPQGAPSYGDHIQNRVRPVFSDKGQYLGMGLRFSLLPISRGDMPATRCAERIWRVNAGISDGQSNADPSRRHYKLLKRNRFASRKCGELGFQVATHRPAENLFVAAGEQPVSPAQTAWTVADLGGTDFDVGTLVDEFRGTASYVEGSSSELSLMGLYGDYILVIPDATLARGDNLSQLMLRFDYLSAEDLNPGDIGKRATVEVDADLAPIIVP